MCRMVEQFGDERETKGKAEGKIEMINGMLKKKIPLETALECAKMSKETYEKYAKQLQQTFEKIKQGVDFMCKMVEDFTKEREDKAYLKGEFKGKVKTVNNILADNIQLETALRYAQIDKKTYEKYSKLLK